MIPKYSRRILFFSFLIFFVVGISNEGFGQEKRNGNEFEYSDCGCSGGINLKIYNGNKTLGAQSYHYGGRRVQDTDEVEPGAVTVANLNNTDGDASIDVVDPSVTAHSSGRHEVDLMRLVIVKSGIFSPTCTHVKLSHSPELKFWSSYRKVNNLDSYVQNIPLTELPKTVWVEATAPSTSVRSMEIIAEVTDNATGFVTGFDLVKVTAIWVDFVKRYIIKTNTGVENSSPAALNLDKPKVVDFIENTLKNNANERYGLGESTDFNASVYTHPQMGGSCPTGPFLTHNAAYAANILTEYSIKPADLNTDNDLNGIRDIKDLNIQFDFARQVNADESVIMKNNHEWENHPDLADEPFPPNVEDSNDDGGATFDEDRIPYIDPISGVGDTKIYSVDAPGVFYTGFFDPEFSYYKRNLQFKEFVRVSFVNPIDGDGSAKGSRCSDIIEWSTRYTLKKSLIPGASEEYNSCQHQFVQEDNQISHSQVTPVLSTDDGTGHISVNFLLNPITCRYVLSYTHSSLSWTLIRIDSGPGSPHSSPATTQIPGTGEWIVEDPNGMLEVKIMDDGSFNKNMNYRFNVLNEVPTNSLN